MSDHLDLIVLVVGFIAVFVTTGVFFIVLISIVDNIYAADSIVLRFCSSISAIL